MRIRRSSTIHIYLCVELGKSPMGTKYLLENTQSGSSVTRALVYRWHIWVSDDLLAPLKLTVKHTIITSLTLNALQHYARKTVRGLVLRNSITAAFAHTIISVHMYMISGFNIIWNSFDCMVQWEGLGMSKTHQRNLLTWRLRRRSAPHTSRWCSSYVLCDWPSVVMWLIIYM